MFESPVDVFDAEWLASAYRAGSSEAAILQELYEAPFSEYAAGSRLYLTCLADKEIRPEWQRWVAREVLHAEVLPLEAGHYAHVTMAGKVCAAVMAFAQAGLQRDRLLNSTAVFTRVLPDIRNVRTRLQHSLE